MKRSKLGIDIVRIYLILTVLATGQILFLNEESLTSIGHYFLMKSFLPWMLIFKQFSLDTTLLFFYPLYIICNTGTLYFIGSKLEILLSRNKRF
ncbi:hypothetical protein HN784_03140 [bacterium]|jgi:hypothetical protein|nr:hypothetical protein [bacterium]MBT4251289.1 hypothetical protein [bacterium]MBT4598330.1 hypothetical protein [bacterium]MBT6754163.1 hypothetical protein [bacterium]MBT7037983.1 hypothetical protein [bacterium]